MATFGKFKDYLIIGLAVLFGGGSLILFMLFLLAGSPEGPLPLGAPPSLPLNDPDDLVLPGPDGRQAALQWPLDGLDRHRFNP
jgi:hypothetical protein